MLKTSNLTIGKPNIPKYDYVNKLKKYLIPRKELELLLKEAEV